MAQLQAYHSADCRVINNTLQSSNVTYEISDPYQGSYDVALGTAGQCQVILGGNIGASLPCATVADYATKLIGTCSTSSATTGGVYYPSGATFGLDNVAPLDQSSGATLPSPYIALSQIYEQ